MTRHNSHIESLTRKDLHGYSKFFFLGIRSKLGVIVPLLNSLRGSIEEEGSSRLEHIKGTCPMHLTDVSAASVDEERKLMIGTCPTNLTDEFTTLL